MHRRGPRQHLRRAVARKLEVLEQKYDGQFRVVFDAIRLLMAPGVAAERKRIGF